MLNVYLDLILTIGTVILGHQAIMICIELVCEGLRRIYRKRWHARYRQSNETENVIIFSQE
jgi:hypothetical protein